MDRLTNEDIQKLLNYHPADECLGECFTSIALLELQEYRATGLTPEEISLFVKCDAMQVSKRELQISMENDRLKEEINTLKAQLDAAIQVIYSVPTCTNCIHMDECDEIGGRCEGRGYGGDCHEPYDEPHFKWRGEEDTTCE